MNQFLSLFTIAFFLFWGNYGCKNESSSSERADASVAFPDLDASIKTDATVLPVDASASDSTSNIDMDANAHDAGHQCIFDTWPAPTTECGEETGRCIWESMTEADINACFEADPDCESCINDSYFSCLIGDEETPGRCADAYACILGCIVGECGERFSDSCLERARRGTCASQDRQFRDCFNVNLSANETCIEGAYVSCGAIADISEDACPLNRTPSEELGFRVFDGSFFDHADHFTGSCLDGRDAVYQWRAPADALYDFSMLSLGDFVYDGEILTAESGRGQITILDGGECNASREVLECDVAGSSATVQLSLNEGDEVLVVASRALDLDRSDGIYDVTAPYIISITSCTPMCDERACGDDGCGGSCGTCGFGEECNREGICECVPNCTRRQCGDDGCGGSCGTCSSTSTCSRSGQCICTPMCDGRECGSNGCGGTCGRCGLGTSCSAGQCIDDPDSCDPIRNAGCEGANECILLSNETTRCALAGSGTQGSSCSTTGDCQGGHSCFSGTCRKICDIRFGSGCSSGYTCNGVSGWTEHGACAPE